MIPTSDSRPLRVPTGSIPVRPTTTTTSTSTPSTQINSDSVTFTTSDSGSSRDCLDALDACYHYRTTIVDLIYTNKMGLRASQDLLPPGIARDKVELNTERVQQHEI
ncbi:hypothetical protein D9756_007039 [Leucocoprinus leucothites]|uniref:Uncharacterized protein n=1 Tax=Leucocoprinus leucothites TaxID=201217 RepID=A0A8H5D6B9_9AGAR|nr:hypothetical protein D9756_007039 [Leucoagaricus leucothites]